MTKIVVPDGIRRMRVDKVLAAALPDVSRATVQRWLGEHRVTLDGRLCGAKDHVSAGDILGVEPGPSPLSRAEPDASVEFGVLFEDEHLIVVDKPPGLVVHPGRGHASGTLVNGLLARDGFGRPPPDERDPEGAQRPGIVHRIDKDTSGVMVVAKNAAAREGLKTQFAEHSISRRYVAVTDGVPVEGRIETIHRRHPSQRLKFTSFGEGGKRAVTHLAIITALPLGIAVVECRLETGRTHQIRVHLAEQCRTPIVCDALYGRPMRKPFLVGAAARLGRQALHAELLGFNHPISRQPMSFEAALPADIAGFIQEARAV